MEKNHETPDFQSIADGIKKDAPRFAAVTAREFFTESFYSQGFTDASFTPWPDRRYNTDPGRAILIGPGSGRLRDSIRIVEMTADRVVIGNDAPYAAIHNEGGAISMRVTDRMRRYFWAMYKTTRQERWKWMALTKKTHLNVVIPKRQFMGNSQKLMEQIDGWMMNQIIKRFKAL